MKVLVTVTNYSKYCPKGKKLLENKGFEIIENPHGRPYTFEELQEVVGDVDAVVAGVDTWDEQVFQLAPALKIIARFGVGVDNIDLESAKAHSIVVCNSPGINTTAVAEQAVAFILSMTRQIPYLNQETKQGVWPRVMMHELKNRTVGLLGFGGIGRNVCEKLAGFHPRLIAYDKYPNEQEAERLHVKLVSFETVLQESDIISIHLPALAETKGIINIDTINQMKEGVLLLNTARGSIVKEKDVVDAVKRGKIAAFATDVYEQEPVMPDNPLFALDQCITTPHTSAETYENCEETSVVTAEAIINILEGREADHRLV